MRRREFITLVGGAAVWPVVARAQQSTMPVVGFLADGTPEGFAPRVAALKRGLSETGFVEGQNVAIEFRWARRNYDLLPALAEDLVRRQVSAIVTAGSEKVTRAAKAATKTIPDRRYRCWRSCQARSRREHKSPRRQPDRGEPLHIQQQRSGRKTCRTYARASAEGRYHWMASRYEHPRLR